jgi:hypothetical protein
MNQIEYLNLNYRHKYIDFSKFGNVQRLILNGYKYPVDFSKLVFLKILILKNYKFKIQIHNNLLLNTLYLYNYHHYLNISKNKNLKKIIGTTQYNKYLEIQIKTKSAIIIQRQWRKYFKNLQQIVNHCLFNAVGMLFE